VLALPAVVDLETANRALGLSRTTGYRYAKEGKYPCRIIRLPRGYRVVSADLQNLIRSMEEADADGSDAVQQDAA
jgi:predicted site-specific integrase-resolvase